MSKGQKRQCMLTAVVFEHEDPSLMIQPAVVDAIVYGIKRDANLRKEVISATLRDAECVKLIAGAVLNAKATDIGLQYPGTVAEFFCNIRRRLARTNSSKVHKKVRKDN